MYRKWCSYWRSLRRKLVTESELQKAMARIRELEMALGKSTMKVEILQEAVRIGR
jgi:hypothetical protein